MTGSTASITLISLAALVILLGAVVFHNRKQSRAFRVTARIENARLIHSLVSSYARRAQLTDHDLFHCQLAVDEAATNIIRHSYHGRHDGEIDVYVIARPGVLEIHLMDFGEPYDPAMVSERQKDPTLVAARPGGWGLHLIRSVMDEVAYSTGPSGNRLVMVKYRHREAG